MSVRCFCQLCTTKCDRSTASRFQVGPERARIEGQILDMGKHVVVTCCDGHKRQDRRHGHGRYSSHSYHAQHQSSIAPSQHRSPRSSHPRITAKQPVRLTRSSDQTSSSSLCSSASIAIPTPAGRFPLKALFSARFRPSASLRIDVEVGPGPAIGQREEELCACCRADCKGASPRNEPEERDSPSKFAWMEDRDETG